MPDTCKHCHGEIPTDRIGSRRTFAARRGFCSSACHVAYTPILRTGLCANETCTRGEGGTRKVFTTYQAATKCCSRACGNVQWQRERNWRSGTPRPEPHMVDLPTAEIERRLEALSRKRREQRSWLRIEDPWAQRPGAALHQQAVVTHGVELEGALA